MGFIYVKAPKATFLGTQCRGTPPAFRIQGLGHDTLRRGVVLIGRSRESSTLQILWVQSPRSLSRNPRRTTDVCHQNVGLHSCSTNRIAFDPKPFIRTFEAAVDKLIAVRKDVQAKTEQMEKSVRVAEREYSKKMADLNRGFEVCTRFFSMQGYLYSYQTVGNSFTGMESRMSQVSNTAVRIGLCVDLQHPRS